MMEKDISLRLSCKDYSVLKTRKLSVLSSGHRNTRRRYEFGVRREGKLRKKRTEEKLYTSVPLPADRSARGNQVARSAKWLVGWPAASRGTGQGARTPERKWFQVGARKWELMNPINDKWNLKPDSHQSVIFARRTRCKVTSASAVLTGSSAAKL